MTRWRTTAVAAACGIVFAGLALITAPASATSIVDVPRGVQLVELGARQPHIAPLQVDGFAPGMAVTQRFEVRRHGSALHRLPAVLVDEVEDYEAGCVQPEREADDDSCGSSAGEGELSTQLLIGYAWSQRGSCGDAPQPSRGDTFKAAAGTHVLAPPGLALGHPVCLAVTVELPRSADNVVQSDLMRFTLRIDAVRQLPGLRIGQVSSRLLAAGG